MVGPSAVDRGDGSWSVSVYAPEGEAERMRAEGLTVQALKPAARLRDEWAAATPTAEAGYLGSEALSARLDALAVAHPETCAVEPLPHRTHEQQAVPLLRIGTGNGPSVVVIGGVHAREWAPPDALLSLAEGLVGAYARGGAFDHPEWVDRSGSGPITYAAWSVPGAEVKRIVEGVTLLLVPLVNPDGRDFSLESSADEHRSDPTARRRSLYAVKQALGLYPTTGTSDDWCVGLSLLDGSRPPMLAFCLECGIDQAPGDPDDDEGGFHPDYERKFPKIEREVHAAVLALAGTAA